LKNYWHSDPCENDQNPTALKQPRKGMAMRRRDPNRLSKILEARLAQVGQKRLHVEVVPSEAISKPVLLNAALPRPRRPKGIPKARRA
jgi:hypothetical protein